MKQRNIPNSADGEQTSEAGQDKRWTIAGEANEAPVPKAAREAGRGSLAGNLLGLHSEAAPKRRSKLAE